MCVKKHGGCVAGLKTHMVRLALAGLLAYGRAEGFGGRGSGFCIGVSGVSSRLWCVVEVGKVVVVGVVVGGLSGGSGVVVEADAQ